MDQMKSASSKLFVSSIVENKDEVEEKYERSYLALQNLISGLSDKEAQNALNNAVCKDKAHEELSIGLLFIILTKPQNAGKTYRDLTLITRDGLSQVLTHLTHLVMERYLRLTDVARSQLLWLLREMIRNGITNVENLCMNLMRHAAGGDVSPKNVFLIETLLDIFQENRSWLDKFPMLITSVVYTFLRLIEDHWSPQLAALRQKEVTFVIALIRERFGECLTIGRDFVRLLQNVARIPEFDKLWRDILLKPKSLCPNFSGILQLLQTRTSRRFFQSRLTPDMEKKLVFLTSSVRFGYHKRYQEWFQRQYLATPESQSLRCDLIRFIVGVIHPTNELLCSDIIPRWAVIGWLITTCTSSVAGANAKLALFYDWLFFEGEKDNIMNIEPAILVMHNSMRSHPAVTATLLDFLCRIIPNFYPVLADKVRAGIFSSLNQILEKRVLPSLYPLFDSKTLDRDLRSMVREVFKEFCVPPSSEGKGRKHLPYTTGKMEEFPSGPNAMVKDEICERIQENHAPNNHIGGDIEPAFSDEEDDKRTGGEDDDDDDIPLGDRTTRVRFKDKPIESKTKDLGSDVTRHLEGELRRVVEILRLEKDNEARCQAMEQLVQIIIQEVDVDSDTTTSLGLSLTSVLKEQFQSSVFPTTINDESIEDSIGKPLFVMFRNIIELPEGDSRRHPILSVLAEMSSHQHKIGYLLLYFLKACKLNGNKSSVYKDFCQSLDKDMESCLYSDLKICQEDDHHLFCWLIPEVYSMFPNIMLGNSRILNLVVSTVDASQLQELICHILQGRLVMFKTESLRTLLTSSLTWETFEQYCLWQLIIAHGIPIDCVLPILPRLEFSNHAEALTSILLLLKQERPSADLLKHLMSREVCTSSEDMFVISVLKYWCRDHEERLGDLIAGLLSSRYPNTSPNKRKRTGASKSSSVGPPSAEQVLGHLDQLRHCCRHNGYNLYAMDSMQRALQQAQNACTDKERKKFSDLFALAEVDDVVEVTKSGKGSGGRGRKGASGSGSSKGGKSKPLPESSDDSSEEEAIVKPKHPKKRKKVIVVGSDSD